MSNLSLHETIQAPIRAIQQLFESNERRADDELERIVTAHFQGLFKNKESQVPDLYAIHRDAPVGSLVRFRAMVQDTVGDEVFAATNADGDRCTMYSEPSGTDAFPDTSDYTRFRQRHLLYCTEVPCETEWARQDAYNTTDMFTTLSQLSVAEENTAAKSHSDAIAKKFASKRPHIGALVKLSALEEPPKPTEIIDVYGVYEQSGWSPIANMDLSADTEAGLAVPCIYTVFWSSAVRPTIPATVLSSADWLLEREGLIDYLANTLDGDRDAATWLLLHLLSRIHSRRASLALGNFPLNLVFAESLRVDGVEAAIASLVPAMRSLRVDIPTLNDPREPAYQPCSIDENLQAGQLQLPAGTHIFLDETQMKEGQLNDKGVKNVQALATLIADQSISYIFPFSQFAFQTDLPVLAISYGKSFLQMPLVVPVGGVEGRKTSPRPTHKSLEVWRDQMRKLKWVNVEIPEHMINHIEADFVLQRKSLPSFSQDDLSVRMSAARLMAISLGKTVLDEEAWRFTVDLDNRRRNGLAVRNKAT